MATEFNAEFINRRMEEHRRWQHAALHELLTEVIDEVHALPPRKPRTGLLFEDDSLLGKQEYDVAARFARRQVLTL